ncbi:hypothetical protein BH11PSE11_BH11PSE11_12330 [soil metagenome]
MTQQLALSKRPKVEARTGQSRSSIYQQMSEGQFPTPVRIGVRAVAWIDYEIDAMIAARVAGKSTDEIKALVRKLESARKNVAESA